MNWLSITLRVLHVGAGVFWAGATFSFALFVEPAATAAGLEGGRFVQRLASGPYPVAMGTAGAVTVLAGLWLLAMDSGGFQAAFMSSPSGLALSIGGLCGVVAAIVGIGVAARNAARLKRVATATQGQPGGPTPEQLAQAAAIRGKLRLGGRVAAALLVVTVISMAVARYI